MQRKWLWSTWRGGIVAKEGEKISPDGFGRQDHPGSIDRILQTKSGIKTRELSAVAPIF